MEKSAGMIVAGGLCLVLSYYDLTSERILGHHSEHPGLDAMHHRQDNMYRWWSVTLQDVVGTYPDGRTIVIPANEMIYVVYQSAEIPAKGDTIKVCVGENNQTVTVTLDPFVNVKPAPVAYWNFGYKNDFKETHGKNHCLYSY